MELNVATDLLYDGLLNIEGKPPSLVISLYHISIVLIGVALFYYWTFFLAPFLAKFLAKYKRKMFFTLLLLIVFNIVGLCYPYWDTWLPTHVVYGWEEGLSAHFFLGKYHLNIVVGLFSILGCCFIVSNLFFGSGLAIYGALFYQCYHLFMIKGLLETGARVPFDGVIYKSTLYSIYYIFSISEKKIFLLTYLYDKDDKRILWDRLSAEIQKSFLDEQRSPQAILANLEELLSTVTAGYSFDLASKIALGVICVLGIVCLCIIGAKLNSPFNKVLYDLDTTHQLTFYIPKMSHYNPGILDSLILKNAGEFLVSKISFYGHIEQLMHFAFNRQEWKAMLIRLIENAHIIRSTVPTEFVCSFDAGLRLWRLSKYILDYGANEFTINGVNSIIVAFVTFINGFRVTGGLTYVFSGVDLIEPSVSVIMEFTQNILYKLSYKADFLVNFVVLFKDFLPQVFGVALMQDNEYIFKIMSNIF